MAMPPRFLGIPPDLLAAAGVAAANQVIQPVALVAGTHEAVSLAAVRKGSYDFRPGIAILGTELLGALCPPSARCFSPSRARR